MFDSLSLKQTTAPIWVTVNVSSIRMYATIVDDRILLYFMLFNLLSAVEEGLSLSIFDRVETTYRS